MLSWVSPFKKMEQFKIIHIGIYGPPDNILGCNSGIFDDFFQVEAVPITAEHQQYLNSH